MFLVLINYKKLILILCNIAVTPTNRSDNIFSNFTKVDKVKIKDIDVLIFSLISLNILSTSFQNDVTETKII